MYSVYKCFVRYRVCKYLFPFCGSYFHSLWYHCSKKSFSFWYSLISFSFSFVASAFGVISKKLLSHPRIWRLTPMFSSMNFSSHLQINDRFWSNWFIWCDILVQFHSIFPKPHFFIWIPSCPIYFLFVSICLECFLSTLFLDASISL